MMKSIYRIDVRRVSHKLLSIKAQLKLKPIGQEKDHQDINQTLQ